MIKGLLLDVDGVIVPEGTLFFPERLSGKIQVPIEEVQHFFYKEFIDCLEGRLDLKEAFTKVLRHWGWMGSVDELLKFWFEQEKDTDPRLLAKVTELRSRGYKCYIASNQEKYRAEYLLSEVGLREQFDGAYFSCYVGAAKHRQTFFRRVLESLPEYKPEELMFWDNDEAYVFNAGQCGIEAHPYRNYQEFIDILNERLP
jgi:putative hydrolase of the HAD superfamily